MTKAELRKKLAGTRLTLVKKWIEALESGHYDQILSALRINNRYSVFGVLCDVVNPNAWNKYATDVYHWHGYTSELAYSVSLAIGPPLKKQVKQLENEGKNFGEIAQYLRTKFNIDD